MAESDSPRAGRLPVLAVAALLAAGCQQPGDTGDRGRAPTSARTSARLPAPVPAVVPDSAGEGMRTFVQQGTASWYGPGFHGRTTASGDRFDQNGLTAAHPSLPFETEVKVTNLENGRSVNVEINDRGPHEEGRIIDLSKAAAEKLGMTGDGTVPVRIQAKVVPQGGGKGGGR